MASRSTPFAAFLCFPLFFLTPLPPCHAKDTLKAGESVADGETLVSTGNVFELGFFTPGKSTKRYVGIWYYNFSTDTVLWVANRESPVHDNSGRLAIDASGNLAILDGGGRAVWSTNATLSKLSNESAMVQLLDTGNLMLNDSSGAVAWQSFDHPIDTYLPGMKVGLDIATGVNQLFTSWRSEDDPAQGNFSMGIDPRGSTQIFLWEGKRPWWRSGRWNQQVFIGIQNMAALYIYGFKLSNFAQEGKMYFYYNVFNSSHRYVLRWNGTEEHLMWRNDTKNWARIWAQPITECEIYNKCGNNARCIDESEPICSCLKGHVPAAAGEWSGGNWTSGCVKRAALQCERNESSGSGGGGDDGFWKMEGVKLPDLSDWESDVLDEDGCRTTCLTNCSCRAYAYVSGIGCLVWGVDLVDVHIFSSGGNDMYLKLAASELEDNKKMLGKFAIAIIVLAVVFALACLYLAFKCRKRMRAFCTRQRGGGIVSLSLNRDGDLTVGTGSFAIPNEAEDHKHPELPLLSFDSISTATANFSRANLLGEGGFGPVYKGTLPGGHEIAVKRLSRGSGQGQDEFKNEVVLIAKLQHRNLVRLLGCCIHSEEKLLIYEYMPNKSLDAFLFDPRKKELLDWNTRYNIIEGIARGLLYLHRDSRLRIIHRDLKTSNILLDKDMDPKISDFGMARIFGNDDSETNTKRVVGTYGYMSPEYAMQGAFSVKSDVYSFGVLLLEIVSGRRNSTFTHQESTLNLLGYAWKLWNEDDVEEFVDPAIRHSCSLTQASRCVNVGLLCVQDKANDRPTMSSVVIMLEGGTDSSPQPRQPTFAAERNQSDTDKSTSDSRGVYSNDSITLLTGR